MPEVGPKRYCEDCRVPLDESGRYCEECAEGRRKLISMLVTDPAARRAQDELNDAHAMLGGMMCHRCNARVDPHSKEAETWFSRETCPRCTAELMDDSRVRDSERRLDEKKKPK